MTLRDWALAGGGALLGALGTLGAVALNDGAPRPRAESRHAALRAQAAEEAAREPSTGEVAFPLQAAEPARAARGAVEHSTPAGDPEVAGSTELLREKRDLESQLRIMEGEVQRMSEIPATGDPSDFDLDAEDWKALAAEGRVRYRIPCPLPSEGSYSTAQPELDALGLSPDDGKVLDEAHRRSNARVWSTLRPLCLHAVGNAEVVDLLGPSQCLGVIDRAARKRDVLASAEARRQVAEVHAGLRPLPADGEPKLPLFTALMAMTSEAEHFRADLAETFGPEEAKRIADGLRCAATMR